MATLPPPIERIVKAYAQEVARQYRVTQVLVFGSYARGTAQAHSDIDVGIVSPDFRHHAEMEILEQLSRIAMRVSPLLEVVAFTPEELQALDPRSFPYHVLQTSIALAA